MQGEKAGSSSAENQPPFVSVTARAMAEAQGWMACPPGDRDESGVPRRPNERGPRGGHMWSIRLKLG